jgi:4-alpha-glucanotransferase
MRVVQFGFDGLPDNLHVPHRHVRECVAYTGTHDNDTTLGWYASLDPVTRQRVDLYLRVTPGAMPELLNRAALGSVAQLAVIPLQDLLALGAEARMNTPGTDRGNWLWRVPPGALTAELARHCAQLNQVFGRV